MPNLSALTPITTAAQSLANLVLVSPQSVTGYQPQNKPPSDGSTSTAQQPPSLLFHYEGEQSVDIESDITDHYVEDNTAIQDQIALKPEIVHAEGFIGELNDVTPSALKPLKFLADKLTTVGAYVPQLSVTALLAYQQAFFLYQTGQTVIDSAVSVWDSLAGGAGQSVIDGQGITLQRSQNKQQAMFQQFYGYWRNRTLFTVQTPWAVFQNMAILSLKPTQDSESRVITSFKVTFKMIRTAATVTTGGIGGLAQGRARAQGASLIDQGTSSPTDSIGLSDGLSSMGVA